MGFVEFIGSRLGTVTGPDEFVVKEKTDLGWVEWGTHGGIILDLDQLRRLRDAGKLSKYDVRRQDDGRYLVTSLQNKVH